MPKKRSSGAEEELKTVQILLVGLLLQGEPRPDLGKLANLIHVRKATLSELFPQRAKRRQDTETGNLEGGEEEND